MSIGVIWGEVWDAAIWDTAIWAQDSVQPPVVAAPQNSGGWLYAPRPRRKEEVTAERIRLGILPAPQEAKAEEAVQYAAEAAKTLSKAAPETQAASNAMLAAQQAEALFMAVYLSVYPALIESQIMEAFRAEVARKAAMEEEETFAMLLLAM